LIRVRPAAGAAGRPAQRATWHLGAALRPLRSLRSLRSRTAKAAWECGPGDGWIAA